MQFLCMTSHSMLLAVESHCRGNTADWHVYMHYVLCMYCSMYIDRI